VVVAKLPDGRWSAPSALTISGLGWGLQIGAELTDVMLILSTDSAVNTFKSRAQVSVGAELGVSVGPIGRSIESDVTAGNKGAAHAFSYAQSKGLFFGASLEASAIACRPDVNRAFYGEKVSPSALLSGEYPPPKGAEPLYAAIRLVLQPSSSSPSSSVMGGSSGANGGNLAQYQQRHYNNTVNSSGSSNLNNSSNSQSSTSAGGSRVNNGNKRNSKLSSQDEFGMDQQFNNYNRGHSGQSNVVMYKNDDETIY
jgi:hypothetical protein